MYVRSYAEKYVCHQAENASDHSYIQIPGTVVELLEINNRNFLTAKVSGIRYVIYGDAANALQN